MLAFNEFFSNSEGMQEFTDTLKFVAGRAPSQETIVENDVVHVA